MFLNMKTILITSSAPQKKGVAFASRTPALICFGAVAFLAGCSSEPESHVVSAPPPAAPIAVVAAVPAATTVTTTQTTPTGTVSTTQPVNTVIVTQAPPALQSEIVQEQPSSQHKWIPGFWTYRESRYVWVAGHWEIPPRPDAVWVAPRWAPESGGYRFYEGYWN